MHVHLKTIRLPFIGDVRYCVRTCRIGCEHVAFTGATFDFFLFCAGSHAVIPVFVGKLAFMIGALGVYFMHCEERIERNGVGYFASAKTRPANEA